MNRVPRSMVDVLANRSFLRSIRAVCGLMSFKHRRQVAWASRYLVPRLEVEDRPPFRAPLQMTSSPAYSVFHDFPSFWALIFKLQKFGGVSLSEGSDFSSEVFFFWKIVFPFFSKKQILVFFQKKHIPWPCEWPPRLSAMADFSTVLVDKISVAAPGGPHWPLHEVEVLRLNCLMKYVIYN